MAAIRRKRDMLRQRYGEINLSISQDRFVQTIAKINGLEQTISSLYAEVRRYALAAGDSEDGDYLEQLELLQDCSLSHLQDSRDRLNACEGTVYPFIVEVRPEHVLGPEERMQTDTPTEDEEARTGADTKEENMQETAQGEQMKDEAKIPEPDAQVGAVMQTAYHAGHYKSNRANKRTTGEPPGVYFEG